jgi:hypothetical protein
MLIYDVQEVQMPWSAGMRVSGLQKSRSGRPVLSRHKHIHVQNSAFSPPFNVAIISLIEFLRCT